MAKVIKSFAFSSTRSNNHPWRQWLDGRIWQLQHGEDFHCKVESFRTAAFVAARRHGIKIRTSVVEGGIVIQAIK